MSQSVSNFGLRCSSWSFIWLLIGCHASIPDDDDDDSSVLAAEAGQQTGGGVGSLTVDRKWSGPQIRTRGGLTGSLLWVFSGFLSIQESNRC